jgi:hypothetical protein
MSVIEELRDTRKIYDIYDVLKLDGRENKIVCPLPSHIHASNTPSFVIFTGEDGVQRFHCHGNCGLKGDVIDLSGYLHIPGYDDHDAEHIRRAISLLDQSTPVRRTPMKTVSKHALPPNLWREYTPPRPRVYEYLKMRGLHSNTVDRFKVGQYQHFLSIPIFEEGALKAIKFRNLWPREMLTEDSFHTLRFWSAKGSHKALFNYDAVAYTTRPLLFLKGEIPVMLCHQYNILACAPTSGEGSYIEKWAPLLALSRKIIVVGDNDQDPEVREQMQAKAAYRAKLLKAELKFPPERYKDIDEWMLADRSALGIIRSWLDG